MSLEKTPRLKNLVRHVPPGFPVDAAWLDRQGIGPKSVSRYVRRGWLEKVTRGVYRRPVPQENFPRMQDWDTALASVQRVMGYRVHLGGTSALKVHRYGSCLWPEEGNPVYLYGTVPSWLSRVPLKSARFHVRSCSLFGGELLGVESSFCAEYGIPLALADETSRDDGESDCVPADGPVRRRDWKLFEPRKPIHVSTRERAVLEVLDDFPERGTFHDLDRMFRSLAIMRTELMTSLLRACRSVKVKRLFFVLAERHAHAWLKYVDKAEIDFGSGPRALTKGGNMHPVYQVYVPDKLLAAYNNDHGDNANVR